MSKVKEISENLKDFENFIRSLQSYDFDGGVLFLNEQHSLMEEQTSIMNDNYDDHWILYEIPSIGWTSDEMVEISKMIKEAGLAFDIIFGSPVPLLIKLTSTMEGLNRKSGITPNRVLLFHNDIREKREFPNGKVIFVVSKTGWKLM